MDAIRDLVGGGAGTPQVGLDEDFGLVPVSSGFHVVVVGAGGNIGSSLVPHLARNLLIGSLTLIDRDSYENGNLASQAILPSDIGRAKAVVQGERACAIRPGLPVSAIVEDLEALPMGTFFGDLILSCVDNARARQTINRISWRLGVPWLDAGISGDEFLVRIDSYAAGEGAGCLECSWTDGQYQTLDQTYLCQGGRRPEESPGGRDGAAPTGASSALGGLAASYQALTAELLLAESGLSLPAGSQIILSAGHHKFQRTLRPANPHCRFDHETWEVEDLEVDLHDLSLSDFLALGRSRLSPPGPVELRCDGSKFARQLLCSVCGLPRPQLRLIHPLWDPASGGMDFSPCSHCQGRMVLTGWALADCLVEGELTPDELDFALAQIGIRPLEVLSLRCPEGRGELHVQIVVPGHRRTEVR